MISQKEEIVEKINKREDKGKVLAETNTIYRIIGKDVFYVESESTDAMFYYIMFNTEKEFEWCSCIDHSVRGKRCKHIFAVEYSIRKGTYIDTDKLPSGVKRDTGHQLQYKSDEYGF